MQDAIVKDYNMAVIVGIDEAGFGPILGPLVVSASVFSLPQQLLNKDFWQVLRKSVGGRPRHLAGRVLIADSKKAFSKSLGIKHLQRTVLACLKCLGKEPVTLTELLSLVSADCLQRLSGYPWYKDAGAQQISVNKTDVAIAASVLQDDLVSNKLKLLELKSCCLDVAYYNKMVSAVRNKASVLFTATCALINSAFDSFAADGLHIIIDRQGGRVRYRRPLQRMFPDMQLKILKETPAASSYELLRDGKQMRLHFAVGADDRFLPVALASMLSKYLRQLLIENINRYFTGFGAELKPTAGYWKDGLRFIEDLKQNIPHVAYDSNQLIRCR
jgi:ribonuclease HII